MYGLYLANAKCRGWVITAVLAVQRGEESEEDVEDGEGEEDEAGGEGVERS